MCQQHSPTIVPDTFVGVFSSFAFLNGGEEGVCSLHNKTATLWLHRLCFALIAILLSGLFYYDSHNFWSDLQSRTLPALKSSFFCAAALMLGKQSSPEMQN